MRKSVRIAKNKPQCIQKPNCNQENDPKKRLQEIAIILENVVYHDGDIEYFAALKYLNIVQTTRKNLTLNQSELLTFCDFLINQLNKIIEIINASSKIETNTISNKDTNIENVNSSQETYCEVLENCGSDDPADTNQLGSDINITQNDSKLKDNKIADKPKYLSSNKPSTSTHINQKDHISEPIDYSLKRNTNQNKSIPTTSKIDKSIVESSNKKYFQTNKPEINSCPLPTNNSKSNETTNQTYSEESVFRKPLNYKRKLQKSRKEVSNETKSTKKLRNNNSAIKKTKMICHMIRKPEQQQFTIHYNATPQSSQYTSEKTLDTDDYNSEDCFDNIFTDNEAADTDDSLMILNLKCKQLSINENPENTTIISEIEESTDWTIESPIVGIQPEPEEINVPSKNEEEELQNKIQEIKSQENFKYDVNKSVVTNIHNYRKTFVRKILQLRDVMQATPLKHHRRQNVNSLFKNTKDSAEIIKSQYTCPPSPKSGRYEAVEAFIHREDEDDEEFIKMLKKKSRELSGTTIQELLQRMDNYKIL